MRLQNPVFEVSYEMIDLHGRWSSARRTSGPYRAWAEVQNEANAVASRVDRRDVRIHLRAGVELPVESLDQATDYIEADWSHTRVLVQPLTGDLYAVIVRTLDNDDNQGLVVWGPYTLDEVDRVSVPNATKVKLRPDAGTQRG
jgi:hypothetical protein